MLANLHGLPEGEPSYDYQGALDYLTADSVNKFWNGYEKNQGEAGSSAYTRDHGLNYALNALAPWFQMEKTMKIRLLKL